MKHFIAKSKLKKANLTDKQITQVYRYKTKTKQLAKAKALISSVHATRVKKFYKTGLGRYVLSKQIKKIYEFSKTPEFAKLSKTEKNKLAKAQTQKQLTLLASRARASKNFQTKQDLLEARQYKLERIRARLNAGEKGYFIERTKEESYRYSNSTNVSVEQYIASHYPEELEKLMKEQNMTYSEAVDELQNRAILEGSLKALEQGVGYGYIDENTQEIISPV